MKQPGTLVTRQAREYLLVEGGYNAATRAVILLARPDDPDFPRDPAVPPLRWAHQGDWCPVARWTAAELAIPAEAHEAKRELIVELIDGYVAKRPAPAPVAWAVRKGENFVGSLESVLPTGLAVHCHDDPQAAESAPDAEQVVPIDNVGLFLTQLVRQGYAGVMWNGRLPICFCADEDGDLQFLRISPNEDGRAAAPGSTRADAVTMEILDETDTWRTYDGAEEIKFIDNREACDERLVAELGRTPVIEWPPDGRLFSLGVREGEPKILSEGEGERMTRQAVLFTSEAAADAFRGDAAPELSVFAVADLVAFLTHDEMAGNVAALNPGAHRAHGGLLWSDGERVVLDSFSGFWALQQGGFEPLDE